MNFLKLIKKVLKTTRYSLKFLVFFEPQTMMKCNSEQLIYINS